MFSQTHTRGLVVGSYTRSRLLKSSDARQRRLAGLRIDRKIQIVGGKYLPFWFHLPPKTEGGEGLEEGDYKFHSSLVLPVPTILCFVF